MTNLCAGVIGGGVTKVEVEVVDAGEEEEEEGGWIPGLERPGVRVGTLLLRMNAVWLVVNTVKVWPSVPM